MSQPLSKLFTSTDLERIAAAVKAAEKKTAGEIVPYAVDRSDAYEEAEWRCGVLLGAVAFALFLLVRRFTTVWIPLDLAEGVLFSLLAGGIGIVLVKFVPAIKRFFAGNALLTLRTHQRAAEAFVSEEVFHTRDRTGILIFLSMLEQRVLVVGDSGINAKVKQEEWDGIVQTIIKGIRDGKGVDGIVEAIGSCGVLLERHGVAIRPDDTDELSDSMRLSDR